MPKLKDVLIDEGVCVSMASVRRLVHGGAVRVDDIEALHTDMPVNPGQTVRVGRRDYVVLSDSDPEE